MIDIKHKVLKAIKKNLSDVSFFKDKNRLEKIILDKKTIKSWGRADTYRMFQEITDDILSKYDINKMLCVFIEHEHTDFNSLEIGLFKAIVYEYYLFLKKVYEIYLLDQIYYLLNSDIDFTSRACSFSKPFKTGSYYESINFGISLSQVAFDGYEENIEVRLYNIKCMYIELINDLLRDKKYLYKKAWLNDNLSFVTIDSNNYYAMQLFIALNSIPSMSKIKKKFAQKKTTDTRQLVLEKFR